MGDNVCLGNTCSDQDRDCWMLKKLVHENRYFCNENGSSDTLRMSGFHECNTKDDT